MKQRPIQFDVIGTKWRIEVEDSVTAATWSGLVEAIQDRIDEFDKTYSRFRSDSLVTKMATARGSYQLPADALRLFDFYKQLYDVTAGKVTPFIGQVMSDAGYDKNYSLKSGTLRRPPAWEVAMSYDSEKIMMHRNALLDFGAAGKGYLVDIVASIIEAANITSYFINAGGDILHRSASGEKITVGLENPFDVTEALGTVELGDKSLCASAPNKRTWGDLHHIIDPDSLRPTSSIGSAWVIADDTMTADGLATALFFTSPARLKSVFKFSYAILDNDGFLNYSPDFPVKLFAETS